jgi:hypothetical protein
MTKIANNLTNSSGGPQSEYVFSYRVFIAKYLFTAHNAR